jgi:epoxyqueuosine reductase
MHAGLRNRLIELAKEQGFDQVGFAPVAVLEKEREDLRQYLSEGRHGAMAWMEREPEKRTDPRLLFRDTQTVMAVGANYFNAALPEATENRIARYARGRDYHNFLPKRLRKVIRAAAAEFPGLEAKVCVDTSPILEKPWAQRAGLGWQGKHTHVVSRTHGNWLILGLALLNVEVESDLPHPDLCGTCNRCVEACPTGALEPHRMDARKCISYLTIEQRGPFPEDTPELAGWAHGCDLCLQACPWNRFEVATHWADFTPRRASLSEEFLADDETMQRELPGTPLARPGIAGLRRNAAWKPTKK